MAEHKLKKGEPDYMVFETWWKFYQAFHDPENDEKYWQQLFDVGTHELALNDKLKESWDLSSELFKATCNVLESRKKSIDEHGDTSHSYEIMLQHDKQLTKRETWKTNRIRELEEELRALKEGRNN